MRKADFEKFTIEIKRIPKKKGLKGFGKGFKNIDDVKDAYNYMVIGLFQKYSLNADKIVDVMKAEWANISSDYMEKFADEVKRYNNENSPKDKMDMAMELLSPFLFGQLYTLGKIPFDKILAMNEYMKVITDKSIDLASDEMTIDEK